MNSRYEVRGDKKSNKWRVFDKKKGVIVLQPMSYRATYNEQLIRKVVQALNRWGYNEAE